MQWHGLAGRTRSSGCVLAHAPAKGYERSWMCETNVWHALGRSNAPIIDHSATQLNDFFILGCSRSGTTLLASLLNSHTDIVVFPETWWIPTAQQFGLRRIERELDLRVFLSTIRDGIDASGGQFYLSAFDEFSTEVGGFVGGYDDLFRLFAQRMKVRFSAQCFGEKTPAHTTYVSELNSRFSEFRRIVLIRDPRDIVASQFHAWYGDYSFSSLRSILKTVKTYFSYLMRELGENVLYVRYEALTEGGASELVRVCDFIGVPPWTGEVRVTRPTAKVGGIHGRLADAVRANSGGYRRLDPRFVWIIEKTMRDEMLYFGYDLNASTVDSASGFGAELEREVSETLFREASAKSSSNWVRRPKRILLRDLKQRWRRLESRLRSRC